VVVADSDQAREPAEAQGSLVQKIGKLFGERARRPLLCHERSIGPVPDGLAG